jgi:hypothetical protein
MLAIAGQNAETNWMIFFEEPHGYLGGYIKFGKSVLKILWAIPDIYLVIIIDLEVILYTTHDVDLWVQKHCSHLTCG